MLHSFNINATGLTKKLFEAKTLGSKKKSFLDQASNRPSDHELIHKPPLIFF